jgi:hypothetical protein
MKLHAIYRVVFTTLILLCSLSVQAQEENKDAVVSVAVPVTVDKGPEDALDRGNPRSRIIGFLSAASEFNWEKASELIKVHSFVKTTDFNEFLEVAEDLNFRIMGVVHSAGTSFALPGRSIFPEGEVTPIQA